MRVATAKAPRREVHYQDFRQLLADARRLVEADAPTTGNWSKGQILEHLARAIEGTIDGFPFAAPWMFRTAARLLRLKQRFLKKGIPSGYQLKNKKMVDHMVPEPTDAAEGLAHLQRAVARIESETKRARHPFLGTLTREESDKFQLLHAEMHMSFIAEPQ